MKTKEDVLDIHQLKRQGVSARQIARKLHISRNTVKKYLKAESLDPRRTRPHRTSRLEPFFGQINHFLEEDEEVSAQWVFERLRNLDYQGGYDMVKRYIRHLKEAKSKIAYEAFETLPGRQAQVDFGEFQVEEENGRIVKYYLFAMVLGYSRRLYVELVEKCDLPTFLDCHIRAFEFFGGVPAEILYDRMRNVYLGRLAGKDRFNDSLVGFALHYGFTPLVAPPYSPWVKGKVERPFRYVRENFWRGYGFTVLERANVDLMHWLLQKEQRVHGTTHERVDIRFSRERPFLHALPPAKFDTSWRVFRKVRKDCTVWFEGNRYVVAHTLVGQKILLRVKDGVLRVFRDDTILVTYNIPEDKGSLIADPRFYRALRADRSQLERKYPRAFRVKARAKKTIGLLRPLYDGIVETRPVADYDRFLEAV